jgi:hypothetical protein
MAMPGATDQMIIHETCGLHVGVTDRRANEGKAALF